jgi:hypothetical protein
VRRLNGRPWSAKFGFTAKSVLLARSSGVCQGSFRVPIGFGVAPIRRYSAQERFLLGQNSEQRLCRTDKRGRTQFRLSTTSPKISGESEREKTSVGTTFPCSLENIMH